MILTKKIFAYSYILPEPKPLAQVNSTSNSIRIKWDPSPEYSHYSIKRNGLEIYKGPYLEFIDVLLTPNSTYSYMVYGHVAENEPGIANQTVFNFSTTALHGTIYTETTSYLNAISVPNDGTVFHKGTAQSITGAEIWTGFNEVVHYLKINNLWDDLFLWHPMFGTTLDQIKKNARDITTYDMDFVGAWEVNSLGLRRDVGNDTGYATYKINNGASKLKMYEIPNNRYRGVGVLVTGNGLGDIEVEFGNARSIPGRFFIAVNVPLYGGFLNALGRDFQAVEALPPIGAFSTSATIWHDESHASYMLNIKNNKILKEGNSKAEPLSSAGHEYTFGCLNEIGVRKHYTTKRIAGTYVSFYTEKLNNAWVNGAMELWANYTKRRVWTASGGNASYNIVEPLGQNELLSPEDITTSDWYKLDVNVEQFDGYMKITETTGSTPHYIYAQSAPQATHICEFDPSSSTADNVYFSFGQQGNIRYGVKIDLNNLTVTDVGNNGNSLFDISLDVQADGWVKVMMKCNSTSGLHDNFTISFSEVDRTSQGKTIVFRNPVAIYNQ